MNVNARRTAWISSEGMPARRIPIVFTPHTQLISCITQNGGMSLLLADAPLKKREPADATELMNRGVPAQQDSVAHLDMPGDQRRVREHALVPDDAIVGHMATGHEHVPVPHSRHSGP